MIKTQQVRFRDNFSATATGKTNLLISDPTSLKTNEIIKDVLPVKEAEFSSHKRFSPVQSFSVVNQGNLKAYEIPHVEIARKTHASFTVIFQLIGKTLGIQLIDEQGRSSRGKARGIPISYNPDEISQLKSFLVDSTFRIYPRDSIQIVAFDCLIGGTKQISLKKKLRKLEKEQELAENLLGTGLNTALRRRLLEMTPMGGGLPPPGMFEFMLPSPARAALYKRYESNEIRKEMDQVVVDIANCEDLVDKPNWLDTMQDLGLKVLPGLITGVFSKVESVVSAIETFSDAQHKRETAEAINSLNRRLLTAEKSIKKYNETIDNARSQNDNSQTQSNDLKKNLAQQLSDLIDQRNDCQKQYNNLIEKLASVNVSQEELEKIAFSEIDKAKPRQDSNNKKEIIEGVLIVSDLIGTIVSKKNPEAGRKIKILASGALSTFIGFSKAIAATTIGGAVTWGGVAANALISTIFSLISSSDNSAALEKQIRKLAKNVSEMRKEVHERFGRIELALSVFHQHVLKEFALIHEENRTVFEGMQRASAQMHSLLEHSNEIVTRGFSNLAYQKFRELFGRVEAACNDPNVLQQHKFDEYIVDLILSASDYTSSAEVTGIQNQTKEPSHINKILGLPFTLSPSINYLAYYLNGLDCGRIDQNLPNLQLWSLCCSWYLNLRNASPQFSQKYGASHQANFRKLYKAGNHLKSSIKSLQSNVQIQKRLVKDLRECLSALKILSLEQLKTLVASTNPLALQELDVRFNVLRAYTELAFNASYESDPVFFALFFSPVQSLVNSKSIFYFLDNLGKKRRDAEYEKDQCEEYFFEQEERLDLIERILSEKAVDIDNKQSEDLPILLDMTLSDLKDFEVKAFPNSVSTQEEPEFLPIKVSNTLRTWPENSLIAATKYGRIDEIERLSNQPGISEKDGLSRTALHYAAALGHQDACQHLLKAAMNPLIQDKYQNTPLHLAAKTGSLQFLKLVAERPDGLTILKSKNKYGQTAKECAQDCDNQEFVALFDSTKNKLETDGLAQATKPQNDSSSSGSKNSADTFNIDDYPVPPIFVPKRISLIDALNGKVEEKDPNRYWIQIISTNNVTEFTLHDREQKSFYGLPHWNAKNKEACSFIKLNVRPMLTNVTWVHPNITNFRVEGNFLILLGRFQKPISHARFETVWYTLVLRLEDLDHPVGGILGCATKNYGIIGDRIGIAEHDGQEMIHFYDLKVTSSSSGLIDNPNLFKSFFEIKKSEFVDAKFENKKLTIKNKSGECYTRTFY